MQIKIIYSPVFLALTILALAGCQTDTGQHPSPAALQIAPVLPSYPNLSPDAPPPAPVEVPPQLTDLQHQAWRAGYWSYDNGHFSWVPGSIIQKPAFTAIWTPDHWEQHEFGWAFVCGYWQ